MDYPDGFSVLGYFKGNYESNYFYVNDKKIDTALAKVIQIFDSEKRAAEYKRIQNEILAHYTIIPLFLDLRRQAYGAIGSNLFRSIRLEFTPCLLRL